MALCTEASAAFASRPGSTWRCPPRPVPFSAHLGAACAVSSVHAAVNAVHWRPSSSRRLDVSWRCQLARVSRSSRSRWGQMPAWTVLTARHHSADPAGCSAASAMTSRMSSWAAAISRISAVARGPEREAGGYQISSSARVCTSISPARRCQTCAGAQLAPERAVHKTASSSAWHSLRILRWSARTSSMTSPRSGPGAGAVNGRRSGWGWRAASSVTAGVLPGSGDAAPAGHKACVDPGEESPWAAVQDWEPVRAMRGITRASGPLRCFRETGPRIAGWRRLPGCGAVNQARAHGRGDAG